MVGFDAEDNGRLDGWDWIVGSRYMADNLDITPDGMILADMVGDADQQLYYEGNSTVVLREAIWQVAADLGYSSFIPRQRFTVLDDHVPFIQKGIPAVDMIDLDYPYWHTTADTLDKISTASLETVGRTVQEWLLLGTPGLPQPEVLRRTFLPRIVRNQGT
ncbi:MAG: M28 family peptidase [Chloroflexaceae bacterium]|nr:M28 family peptidase [Chloroflexaceae bacterium]